MSRNPQVFVFGDRSWPAESIVKALPADALVSLWLDGQGWTRSTFTKKKQSLKAEDAAREIKISSSSTVSQSIAIVGFEDYQTSQRVVEVLREQHDSIKILELGSRGRRASRGRRQLSWAELFSESVDREIYLLSLQDQVRQLRSILQKPERIALLLQDDPDPDGVAAALALRKILGRNSQTAPIVSFGGISRPENVAMTRLLDVEIEKITETELWKFEKVVLVDCQPSFFKGRRVPSHVILDHHPKGDWQIQNEDPELEFCIIREDLGAISTLLALYLRAADIDPSQRLATALLYGIKADTLMLNREVSELDLDAFMQLYPQINFNTLRKIERPELPFAYLESLRKGLAKLESKDGVTILPLPNVDREEWIPQAADFALQVEGSRWAVACGVYQGQVILSGRNCGYVQHCGDVFKRLFGNMGRAGGHRTMAKAIIQKSVWVDKFGENSLSSKRLTAKLIRMIRKDTEDSLLSSGSPHAHA